MKKLIGITLFLLLFILTACESGGKFAVHNETSYPVWVSVDESEVLELASGLSHTFNVDTDTQSFLTGEVKRNVKIMLHGETYSLYYRDDESDNIIYTDSTTVSIKAGKTLNAFLQPNRASIKIHNDNPHTITHAEIWQHKNNVQYRIATLSDIPYGDNVSLRVDPVSPTNLFYYVVNVILENGETLVYGGPETILAIDQQFLIEVLPSK